jgi:hypothetical protein
MARRSLGTLTIDLIAKIGGFESGMDKASRKAKQTGADIGKALSAAAKAAAVLTAAVATAAIGIGTKLVSASREAIDAQAKMAARLRTSYESLETLSRAGALAGVSINEISNAGRQLDLNLGRATQGAKAQADALRRLGLNAQELARLPLDERIQQVNKAIRDNIPLTERAAVAANLFGAKNAVAIAQLDPDTISEAARQTQILGTALSDVDAAKVEMANDAMGTFSLAVKGVGDQLTIRLAPILTDIGNRFLRAADDAGGMESVMQRVFDRVVGAAGFAADAIEGVRRTVTLITDTAIIGIARLQRFLPNALGGLDAATSAGVVAEARANIDRTLNEPLPSSAFKRWVAAVTESGDAAAAAMAASRQVIDDVLDEPLKKLELQEVDASKLIGSLKRVGADAQRELEQLFAEAEGYVRGTRTEVERLEAQIERVQELAARGFFAEGVDADVLARLNERLDEARARVETAEAQFGQLEAFAEQAARNMQTSLADFLFDPFDKGLKGMLEGFIDTINRMVAELLAQKILTSFFGGAGAGSFSAGLSGLFGGTRAFGGPMSPGREYVVGERGPERITLGVPGYASPSAGAVVNQTIHVQGAVDSRTARQMQVEASRRQRVAVARLG